LNDSIRIGLIGLGSWAKSAYVPILQEQSNVRVVAVAAKSSATLQAARNIFGPSTSTHDDYHDLLNHTEVDAVMIGLPASLTAPATIAALNADKHVWVEPPIEVADEGNGVLELASKSDKVFHVDLELRYLPVVKSIQDIVSAGDIGRLLFVRVELSNGSARVEDEPEKSGDVIGLGTWYIDLLDAFVGIEPQRVDVFASYPRYAGLMEWGAFTLQYPDGVVGEWLVNPHNAGDWELRVKLVGSEGEVEANLMDGSYRHRTAGNSWLSGSADCSRPKSGFVGMRESVQAFLAAIQGEKNSLSGPEPYQRIHRSLEALRQSGQQKRSITLDVA
jgi:predicted dehydrogenase